MLILHLLPELALAVVQTAVRQEAQQMPVVMNTKHALFREPGMMALVFVLTAGLFYALTPKLSAPPRNRPAMILPGMPEQ